MALLKKSDILNGINNIQKVEIKSLNGELWLRPLSAAELDEISYIEAEGLGNIKQNVNPTKAANPTMELNPAEVAKASDKSKYEKILRSLDNPKNDNDPWTIEELHSLSKNAIDELNTKINEISGADITERDIKSFPANR